MIDGFSGSSSKKCYSFDTSTSTNSVSISTRSSQSSSMPSPPQSNMVLRKGIRKIKQGMKKYAIPFRFLINYFPTKKLKGSIYFTDIIISCLCFARTYASAKENQQIKQNKSLNYKICWRNSRNKRLNMQIV